MCQAKNPINFDLPIVRQIGNANRGEIHLGNRSQTLLQLCFPPNQDGQTDNPCSIYCPPKLIYSQSIRSRGGPGQTQTENQGCVVAQCEEATQTKTMLQRQRLQRERQNIKDKVEKSKTKHQRQRNRALWGVRKLQLGFWEFCPGLRISGGRRRPRALLQTSLTGHLGKASREQALAS